MARLPDLWRYRDCPIPPEDPLRYHYWPIVGALYRRRIDGCMKLLGIGRRVLDVGYGSGTSFLELGRRFQEVHGLDTHDYGSGVAKVFAREGVRVTLARGSMLEPPYASSAFDAILAMSVFEHLLPGDQPRIMTEARRILRPGGVLVVGMPGVNRFMSIGFRLLGFDISHHHLSSPTMALSAAADRFEVDQVVRQPRFVPDALVTYVWFRASKTS
jgi:SAM-dependent methyltransferase